MADQFNTVSASAGDYVQLDNVILEVYAEEVLHAAQPILRFEQIAEYRSDLQATPGNTVKFLKYSALTGGSEIAEQTDLESTTISTSTISITVSEHARAVGMTELLLRQSVTDQMAQAAVLLGNHYARNRDGIIRDALMAGTNIIYANAKANRAALVAADTYNVDLVRDTVEQLAINKAPKFDDSYVSFVHPRQGKFLRKDNAWVNASLYGATDQIFQGEIGKIEDVRFIETTQIHLIKIGTQDIWVDNADTGNNTAVAANANTDVYRSVTVGRHAVGIAEALPVELRDDGVKNYGRRHAVAYYGIWGAGLIETGHSVIGETA